MGFEGFIANKHLMRQKKTGFVSLVTLISVTGVAVGVMALIVVQAVMSGFDRELKSKIVSVQPHIRIEKINGLDQPDADMVSLQNMNLPGVISMAAFVEGQGILKSANGATGVIVKGLDLGHDDPSVFKSNMKWGSFDLADNVSESIRRKGLFSKEKVVIRTGGIILGEGLAARLNVRVGDRIQLIAPLRDDGSLLSLARAENQTYVLRGIFRLGMNDFDTGLALISLDQAQHLYHLGKAVTGISLRFANVDDAEKWKWDLRKKFWQDYSVRSWYDMNHNFFQALKVEKSVMTILLALIILVAAFNIVSSLTMVVMEKTKDIGILRALGASRGSVRQIFIIEGFSIGIFGVMLGAAAGLGLSYHLNEVSDFIKRTTGLEVFPSDIYYFDKIPAQVNSQDVMWTLIFAMGISIFAGFYPANRAAHLDPVEALRYE